MTADEIRALVGKSLRRIAPEADPARLKPGESLREQLDIDSMDYLNFVISLHEAFQIEIPDADYAGFITLDGCVERVQTLLKAGGR